MSDAVRIGILGDFNAEFRSHHATNEALQHPAHKLNMEVKGDWIPTPSLVKPEAEKTLESFDGFLATPGSPYQSFEGMLKGIEFARRRDWPFLGTCGGFQYAFIEFARNLLHIADADSAENNSGSKNIIVSPVACAVPNDKGHVPKLSGAIPEIRLGSGSCLQTCYGDKEVVCEEFFCNFEINPEFEWTTMEAGFQVIPRGPQGEIRAIESPKHRFYLATLFQPQRSSTEENPHPLVLAFVQAAADWGKKKRDDHVLEQESGRPRVFGL